MPYNPDTAVTAVNHLIDIDSNLVLADGSDAPADTRKEIEKLRRILKRAENVGRVPRPHRVEELIEIVSTLLRLEHPDWSRNQIRSAARRRAGELTERYRDLDAVAKELAPMLCSPPTGIDDAVMANAMLRIPVVRYLQMMLERPGARGPARGTKLPVAGFLWMAWGSDSTSAFRVFDGFRGNLRLSWGMHRPGGGGSNKTLRARMQGALRRTDVALAEHTLVDMVRQVAESTDDSGRLRFPGATDIIAADGMLIEAPVAQKKPLDLVAHHKRHRGLDRTSFVIYRERNRSYLQSVAPVVVDPGEPPFVPPPGIAKKVNGWRFVVLKFLRMNMPVIAGLFPASVDETQAVIELLERLYGLWPELRIRTFVGDGLYDTHQFHDTLARGFGIRTCASRGKKPGQQWESITLHDRKRKVERIVPLTWGVPQCDHGPMEQYSWESDNCTPEARLAAGLRPGEFVEKDTAACKYRCRKRLCPSVRLRASWNSRLANPFPRVDIDDIAAETLPTTPRGFSIDKNAATRLVLTAMRNQVESLFAAIQQDGNATKASLRARWARDDEMEWLLYAALIGRAGRIMAWNSGLYAGAFEEAERLCVRDFPDEQLQMPRVAEHVRTILDERPEILPQPPRTWIDDHQSLGRRLSAQEQHLRDRGLMAA